MHFAICLAAPDKALLINTTCINPLTFPHLN